MFKTLQKIQPQAKSHLCSAGPRPSYPHLCGNSSSLGTNVIIHGQNYKYSSWHHLYYSQVHRWSSFTCQNELNDLSDRVLSHWFPTRKSSHAGADRKTGHWRKRERVGPSRMKMWSSPGPKIRGPKQVRDWNSCATRLPQDNSYCQRLLTPTNRE